MSKIMEERGQLGGQGRWLTLNIGKVEEQSCIPYIEVGDSNPKRFKIVPICFLCEKAAYNSNRQNTGGWCKLKGDIVIPEYDNDTKLKGITLDNLNDDINNKCSTTDPVHEWSMDVRDLKAKLIKQINCLNFFVCNYCELQRVDEFQHNILRSLYYGKINLSKLKEYYDFCRDDDALNILKAFLIEKEYLLDDINETNRLYIDEQVDLNVVQNILNIALKLTDSILYPKIFEPLIRKLLIRVSSHLNVLDVYNLYVRDFNKTTPFKQLGWSLEPATKNDIDGFYTKIRQIAILYSQSNFKESWNELNQLMNE